MRGTVGLDRSISLVGHFADFRQRQVDVLVHLSLVHLVYFGQREGGHVGQNHQSHAIEPGADVGESPKEK